MTSQNSRAERFTYINQTNDAELWHYSQNINHFENTSNSIEKDSNHLDSPFFNQRVFIQRKFSLSNSSPVIVKICGEARCSGYFSELEEAAAKKFNAILISIEHRYYGHSHPFAQMTLPNLKYLTTKQAVHDLVSIIGSAKNELDLQGPLVTIGCSYAGSLSAYLRALHPELSVGAVAISAPVRVQTLLPEADTFRTQALDPQCTSKLRQQIRLFEKVILGMSEDNFRQLVHTIHLNKINTSKETVIELLGDMVTSWVSSNKQRVFCERLSDNPLNLAPLIESFGRYIEYSNKHEDSFEAAAETSVEKAGPDATIRQWLFQTCSEYGFFQITDSSSGVGPLAKNKEFKEAICKKLFNIQQLPSAETINKTFYSPVVNSSSRIAFTNSKKDFWSLLSILPENNRNTELSTILTEDGGHCSASRDFKNGKPGEQAQFVLEQLENWLK